MHILIYVVVSNDTSVDFDYIEFPQGKISVEAMGEVVYGASFVDWFADEARRIYGDVVPSSKPGQRVFHLKQPVGVCGLITPVSLWLNSYIQ